MVMMRNCAVLLLVIVIVLIGEVSGSHGVFSVRYRYGGRDEQTLIDLKAHDDRRQLRILAGVDLPIGGSGRPDAAGLYYTKIGIGTPSKNYYVQVDTGSDIMWVNCIQCGECPRTSSLGIDLTLYNIEDSNSGVMVPCNQEFCYEVNGGLLSGCTSNMSCTYLEIYGDGSSTAGYFVKDIVQYDRVSGDLQTESANGSVIFGCGYRQSGGLGSTEQALDGILGFGKSNSSMISQLATSGRVKKIFAHCLDSTNGGGIFVIGNVVQPKVNMTPLIPNQQHYNVNMTAVQVGRDFLDLPTDLFDAGDIRKGAIIDSGTTLAYLPELIYGPLVSKILSQKPDIKVHTVRDEYTCFQYSGSLDDGFPNVTLYFENSVFLKVYPREYLFPLDGLWCIGWQNSGMQSRDRRNMTLLGDLVLSNKLVLYNLENQTIGWTEYNCSTTIKVKDEQTGTVHLVGYHYVSSGCGLIGYRSIILLFLSMLVHSLV